MNEGALATLNDDAAIAELSSGVMLKQIAERYGCSKPAVYKRLSKHPDYKQAIDLQAEAFVEKAMIEVMECDADTVNIARARVDAAFKWAAARDPHRWGQRTQVDVNINIGDTLQAIAERRQARLAGVSSVVTGETIEHDSQSDQQDK